MLAFGRSKKEDDVRLMTPPLLSPTSPPGVKTRQQSAAKKSRTKAIGTLFNKDKRRKAMSLLTLKEAAAKIKSKAKGK